METNNRTLIIILAITLTIMTILAGVFYKSKATSNRNLDKEKLRNEALLSEKIKLDETLLSLEHKLSALKGKNAVLDKIVAQNKKLIQKKESEIKQLMAENATVNQLKNKIAELEDIQDRLNELTMSYNTAMNENTKLNELLTSMQNENEILGINNAILKAMMADNYRIEALKGKNDKLTINAKRTDRLVVSFDMPAEATNGLFFKVIDPKGNEYSSDNDDAASINITDNSYYLLASTNEVTGQMDTKRTELIYNPKYRLQKGVYIIKIFNNKDYLGSTQLRLK